MKMTCPHCGVIGSAHDSLPGEKVRCPQCDKVFKVMDQEITCPHCAVAGSAAGSTLGAKLRCPRCEKVFLLTMDRFASSSVLADMIAGREEAVPAEAGMAASVAEEKEEFLIPEPEIMVLESGADETIVAESASLPELKPVAQAEMIELSGLELELEPALQQQLPLEPEAEAVPPSASVPVPETAEEMEPMVEAVAESQTEVELEVESVPPPELKLEFEPEPVLEPESVPEMEAEERVAPVMEVEPEAEKFPEAPPEMVSEIIPEPEPEVVSALEPEPEIMPTQVCAGCGESFHPLLLQELEGKLYCGVCQLRMAATTEQPPKVAGGRLRGVFAAVILLGLLALIALLMMKFGIL